jgi:hypothetical protein
MLPAMRAEDARAGHSLLEHAALQPLIARVGAEPDLEERAGELIIGTDPRTSPRSVTSMPLPGCQVNDIVSPRRTSLMSDVERVMDGSIAAPPILRSASAQPDARLRVSCCAPSAQGIQLRADHGKHPP